MNGWAKDLPDAVAAFLSLNAAPPAVHCEMLVTADGRHWTYDFSCDAWTHGFEWWPTEAREQMESVHGSAREIWL